MLKLDMRYIYLPPDITIKGKTNDNSRLWRYILDDGSKTMNLIHFDISKGNLLKPTTCFFYN